MQLHEFPEYMQRINTLRGSEPSRDSLHLRLHSAKDILLSTEDPRVITEAADEERRNSHMMDTSASVGRGGSAENEGHRWSFHYTPFKRVNEWSNFHMIRHHGAVNVSLNAFTNLFLSLHCDAYVTTLGSNWGRLMNELRRTHGKEGVPFVDIEPPRVPHDNRP